MSTSGAQASTSGAPAPARDRVAIITGAGGGLGGAVARLLAGEGSYRGLALVDNRADALEEAVAGLGDGAIETLPLSVDLGDPEGVEAVVPRVIEVFGRVDALVRCAAILHRQAFDEVTPADFESVFRINALAPFLLARAVMPTWRNVAGAAS
jgi:NAD(P)-dependent dehydrogenase (short-subunit alcohol dehydrogenase family)